MEPEETTVDLDRSLSRALRFDQETLLANRDGYMTKKQRETLRQAAYRQQINLGLLIVTIAVAILGILLLETRAYGRLYVSTPVLVFMLALVGVGALGAAFLWSRRRELRADLHKGVVETVVGRARLIIVPRRYYADYKVRVGLQKFSVTKQVLLAFKDAESYRMYYAPFSMTLLSAEPAPDDAFL